MEVAIILLLLGIIIAGLVWLHNAPPAAVVAFVERESVVLAWFKNAIPAAANGLKAAAAKTKVALTPKPKPAALAAPVRVEPVTGLPPTTAPSEKAQAAAKIMAMTELSLADRLHIIDAIK